jgi:hypothetical protein
MRPSDRHGEVDVSQYDEMFQASAVPLLLSAAGEPTRLINYAGKTKTINGIQAVIQDESVEEIDGPQGLEKQRTVPVIVSRDESGPYKGINDPEMKAHVAMDGQRWSVQAIVAKSDSLVTIELVRHEPMEKTFSGYRGVEV